MKFLQKYRSLMVLLCLLISVSFVATYTSIEQMDTSIEEVVLLDGQELNNRLPEETGIEHNSSFSVDSSKPAQSVSSRESLLIRAQQLSEQGEFEEAFGSLRRLYENRKAYSLAEELSILELYGSALKMMEFNQDAITVYEELLAFPELELKVQLDALKALGGLYNLEADYEKGKAAYQAWISGSDRPDADVLKGLSYSFYSLNRLVEAWGPAIDHVAMVGVENVDRNMLMYLNALTFSNEDWENAAWLTQVMIDRFDNAVDWRNLSAIYSHMGEPELQAKAFADALAAGKIDSSGNLIRNQ